MAPLAWSLGTANPSEYLASHNVIIARQDDVSQFSSHSSDSFDQQLMILMSISLSTASVSVLAALCAFYWFVKMRRSFRHDLIMLLIQSDMMKALWLVICPLAFFARVPIDSASAFCQISGFFLAVSIEASDIAVLLIAIHTALFILKPRGTRGASGLYPYRRIAYTFWGIMPIALAATVPITGGRFQNNGTHCYLPVHPSWYLRALSWVPRYIIFAFIIVTYTILYLYIAIRMQRFGKDQRRASILHAAHLDHHRDHHRDHGDHGEEAPPTPPIADHGLLDSARQSLAKDDEARCRQISVTSTTSTLNSGNGTPTRIGPASRSSIKWNVVDFANDSTTESRPRQESQALLLNQVSSGSSSGKEIAIRAPEPAHVNLPRLSQQSTQSYFFWKPPSSVGSRDLMGSVSNMVNHTLHRKPPQSMKSRGSTSMSSSSHDETEEVMRRSREKQQRQLRLLFVYPLIYMLTWISPFVCHVLRFDAYNGSGYQSANDPLALQIVSLTSLCIGAAVDCGFFTAWEKPWLHLRGGFWEGLALRLRIKRPIRRRRRGVGRNSEERFLDARTARVRREQEENIENQNNEAAAAAGRTSRLGPRMSASTQRQWWDVLDEEMSEASPRRSSWPREGAAYK
ncbi:G protein-coupled glucose receptor regulating Gpa2-domain-containing protein [Hypomontagnella monticulosa]|nr:G protein-coupled glucose receptor regulating Gpa2-domain-containing protein [Hypomontagnella monticulosa]